jgi:hypothetical protein
MPECSTGFSRRFVFRCGSQPQICGATENTTPLTDLLVGLRDRGLDVTGPVLVVIDGAKALRSAVETVFDCPVVARCQLHKIRNAQSKLPDQMAATVGTKMRAAYKTASALKAETAPVGLARQLDRSHPGPHAALYQRDRVHDRDLPGPLHQRQELAGRDHGAALVRSRDERSRQAVPQGQRAPPLPRPAHRPRRRSSPPARRDCHTPQLRSERGLNRPPTVTEVPRNSGHPRTIPSLPVLDGPRMIDSWKTSWTWSASLKSL